MPAPLILDSREAILERLIEAEEGPRGGDAGPQRYAGYVVCYKGARGSPTFCKVGERSSLHEALDGLAATLAQKSGVAGAGAASRIAERLDCLGPDTDFDRWLAPERKWAVPYLQRLASPERRFFAYWALGWVSGPFEIVTSAFEDSPYIGKLGSFHPAARYVLGLVAAPPHQDEAACILALPPKQRLGRHDKALFAACASGDLAAVEAALGAGAAVNGRDSDGNAPLHHAVAHRRHAVVERLLDAGADPDLGAEERDPPLFAGLSTKGGVGPYATRIEGPEHFALLKLLIERGARASTTRPDGRSIVDLATATLPYPESWVGFFLARGAVPKGMRSPRPLHERAAQLRWRHRTDPDVLVNELRLLLQAGAAPNLQNPHGFPRGNTPLHELLQLGYRADELDPAVLLTLVELFLAHGAKPLRNEEGRTPADCAERWVQHLPHYRALADRLRAASAAPEPGP